MAQRVEVFNHTYAAGAISTTVTQMTFPAGDVDRIEVEFPNGCAGHVGVIIGNGNAQVIPAAIGTNLFGNDETVSFDIEGYLNTGNWQLFGFNLDTVYPHTITVRFWVTEVATPGLLDLPAVLLLPAAGS